MIKKRLKLDDRDAIKSWDEFVKAMQQMAIVDSTESIADKRQRIASLEADVESWFKYYFPTYYKCNPARFHKKATYRLLNNSRHYEVRAWARELAKTARTMMEVTYLAMKGEIKNILYISNSYDNAVRLLTPIRLTLEKNLRISNDYGNQIKPGAWEEGEFTTLQGVSFRAIGAAQSPRGTRNEEARPDCIIIDDIDTDEECRNPERIKNKWKWLEEAVIPTVSISGNYRIVFNGNIIARDCCITRAMEKADYVDVINIRDNLGKSTWPDKNSEQDIDNILAKISTAAAQKEYFNNPVSEGDVFKEMTWGKCPNLKSLPFVVVYGDPSTSNRRSKNTSYKANFLVGFLQGKYYIYTGYLEQTTNDEYIENFYRLRNYVSNQTTVYYFNENNTLQDPFWQQVLKPLLIKKGAKRGIIPIAADTRSKMDKYSRIEASLEPLNRSGLLIFNERERGNPHMKRLEEQFLMISPNLPAPADGPDAIEGAVWIINQKIQELKPDSIVIGGRYVNKNRF